jgi:hypothetical protein
MAELFTPGISLMDDSFDPGETRNYELAFFLGETGMTFCLLDVRRNKYIGLQQLSRTGSGESGKIAAWPGFLESVLAGYPWLLAPFRQIRAGYDGMRATLVPAALFDPGEKENYMNFNFTPGPGEQVLYDHLQSMDACQLFTIPADILGTVKKHFPGTRIVHMASVLIETIRINYKNRISSPRVFLHLRGRICDIMIFDGRQLNYFNSFAIQGPEDVTYYLIFVMEQLNLNPETVPLVLLGGVAEEPGLDELLARYVRHVEPGRRNDAFKYSYVLNQMPPYAFYPLYNFFSCGL